MATTVKPRFVTRTFDPQHVATLQEQGLSPGMARILAGRGIETAESLVYDLRKAIPVSKLTNSGQMAKHLADKIEAGHKFLLVADYDSDGATSCAIGMRAMRGFGADIDFMVPNRFVHGYGLTPEIVQEVVAKAKAEGTRQPDCILTVDNGVASVAGVAEANLNGIKVLVTDHHLAGDTLPDAECIVNPNQPGCDFPSKNLAGCGVIFYCMLALKKELTDRKWFDTHPQFNMMELMDYVALGTVADVVRLDDNNRRLVSVGLDRMRKGLAHPGIKALMDVAGCKIEEANSAHMGFNVGPRLNAAGRLDDMSIGISCLLADNDEDAHRLAQQLDALNRERRSIESDMTEQAVVQIDSMEFDPQDKYSMVLFHPDWHQGVIGILASRIKDKTNRPAIVFGRGTNGELKGSCRSIPGLHMRDALDMVYKQNPGLITKFGGHSMAAGLTIMEKDLDKFTVEFEESVRVLLPKEALELVIHTDGPLNPESMSMELAKEIQGQVWGQGFMEPVFQGEFEVIKQRQVGKDLGHVKLTLGLNGSKFDAIFFHQKDPLPENIIATYSLNINDYNNTQKVDLRIHKYQDTATPVHVHQTDFVKGPEGLDM